MDAEQIPLSFGGIAGPNTNRWHGRSRLKMIPHNAVHNYVGGESSSGSLGDMTELATAALDPVLFAHHAKPGSPMRGLAQRSDAQGQRADRSGLPTAALSVSLARRDGRHGVGR
jgi:Common central domain of tyrosinase